MELRVYNTLSRDKEEFKTIEPKRVRMYVCGPTVYDKAHVGHAMSALVFDVIRRYLEYKGYKVRHVMNYTDVDDKIIQRANRLQVDPFELAEGYIREYDQHLRALNILPATVNPRATTEIASIIDLVQDLVDKGFAYEVDGDVYYRVNRKEDYGKLSGRKLADMRAGSRIGVDERKENPLDFALWKATKEGEPAWDSPWGKGRPGWHIECSTMSIHHLGEQIDIHGGGNDLIFPHHENEIAQSEAYSGKQFARYWVHNGMLQLSGEKMSKSIGNLVTVEDFLAEHPADALRMMVLNSGYRNPLTFSDEVIEQAEKALERLRSALKPALAEAESLSEEKLRALQGSLRDARHKFEEAMDDDFNSAGALGHLFDLVRFINQTRADGADDEQLADAQETLLDLTGVLGLTLREQRTEQAADPFVDLLLEVRQKVRERKMWNLADMIRDRLDEMGVQVEDAKSRSNWSWK